MPASAKYSCKIEVPEGHQEAVQRYLQSQGEVLSGGNLSANWEVHQGVDRILNPPPASQDTSRIRYTLRAENQQLGVFVRSLCAQLGLECKVIDVPDEAEQQRITFRVEKAKLRTLIEKVLESTELDFQLSADQLTITKKGKAE